MTAPRTGRAETASALCLVSLHEAPTGHSGGGRRAHSQDKSEEARGGKPGSIFGASEPTPPNASFISCRPEGGTSWAAGCGRHGLTLHGRVWSAKSKAQNGENARFSDPLCLGREEDRPQRSECARTHSLAWAVTGNPEGPFGGASAGWGGPQGPLHHPHFSTPLSSAEQPVLLCLASLPHSWLGRRHLRPRRPRRRAPAWLAHASHCRPATWTEGI